MKSIFIFVLLISVQLVWANQDLLLDGLLSAESVANDRCLSASNLTYTVNQLLSEEIITALATLQADPAQSIANITSFIKTVFTVALSNNPYWRNGYSTNAYFGFSTDSVYSIRNCSLPENALLQGCLSDPAPALLAYLRNNITFDDISRHVWSMDNEGNLIEELYVESRVSYATANLWYSSPGWISFTSLTSGLQTFTYSKVVPGIEGAVAVSDRSFREPCAPCIQSAPAVSSAEELNDMAPAQPSTMEDLNTLTKAVWTAVNDASAAQVGFPSGDFIQVKNCADRATEPSESYCAPGTTSHVAAIYSPVILGTESIRVFNVSATGELVTTSYVDYQGRNSTSQPWYAVGQQGRGFSPIYRRADSTLVRSFVIGRGADSVVAADTLEEECASAPVSTNQPQSNPSSPNAQSPQVSSASVVALTIGSMIGLCALF